MKNLMVLFWARVTVFIAPSSCTDTALHQNKLNTLSTDRAHVSVRSTTNANGCAYTHGWPPQKNPAILIPLYTNGPLPLDPNGACAHHMYQNVSRGCRAVTAVLNTLNGPFPPLSTNAPALKICMKMLNDSGVTMVGYVHTKIATMDPATGVWTTSGMRDKAEVATEMDYWVTLSEGMVNFKGFFLDDTTSFYQTYHNVFGIDHIAWYRELISLGKSKIAHALTVLNPGAFVDLRLMTADPAAGYPEPADITIPFEDYAWRWSPPNNDCGSFKTPAQAAKGTFGPGPWCANIPIWDQVEPFIAAVANKSVNVAALAHSASLQFALDQVKVAEANGFKYFYATERTLLQGAWDSVPIFWDEYLSYLDASENTTVGETSCASITETATGPFPTGCLQQWWIDAGCTTSGTQAPALNNQYWYQNALTTAQIKNNFSGYASLENLHAACVGIQTHECASDTGIAPFPQGCMVKWWIDAGCKTTGTFAPTDNTTSWHRPDLTALEVKTDFIQFNKNALNHVGEANAQCGI